MEHGPDSQENSPEYRSQLGFEVEAHYLAEISVVFGDVYCELKTNRRYKLLVYSQNSSSFFWSYETSTPKP